MIKSFTGKIKKVLAVFVIVSLLPLSYAAYAEEITEPTEVGAPDEVCGEDIIEAIPETQEETTVAVEEVSDVPAESENATEAPTEPAITSEANLILTEDILDSNSITDRILSSGIVQVMIGYQFDDGSFDPWYTVPGFAVNEQTVITSQSAVITYSSDIYTKMSEEKYNGYMGLGIDLMDYNTVAAHFVYRVYDGGETLLEATKASDPIVNGHFTVLKVKGILGNPYKIYKGAMSDAEMLYGIGVVKNAISVDHFLTENDLIEQRLSISEINAADKIIFTSNAVEYFDICPLVSVNGVLAGFVESFDENGNGVGCKAEQLIAILNNLGIQYEAIERTVTQANLQYSAIDSALSKAMSVEQDKLKDSSLEKFCKVYAEAIELRDREGITQDDIDEMTGTLNETLLTLEYKGSGMDPFVLIVIVCISIIIIGAGLYLYLALKKTKKQEPAPFDYEDDELEEDIPKKNNKEQKKSKTEPGKAVKKEEKKPEKAHEKKVTQEKKSARPAEENKQLKPAEKKAEPKKPVKASEKMVVVNKGDIEVRTREKEPDEYDDESPTLAYFDEDEAPTRLLEDPADYVLHLESTDEDTHLSKFPFIVGKSKKADMTISNDTVSRRHLEITYEKGVYYVMDLESMNGTQLNGEVLNANQKYEIKSGDELTLSNEKAQFINRNEG